MDMKGIVFMIYATIFYTFSNGSVYSCPGQVLVIMCIHFVFSFFFKVKSHLKQMCKFLRINGTPCCQGHRWNFPQNKCIRKYMYKSKLKWRKIIIFWTCFVYLQVFFQLQNVDCFSIKHIKNVLLCVCLGLYFNINHIKPSFLENDT